MNKNIPIIIAVVCCALLIFALVQISNLNQQIIHINNNISNQISGISNSINNIYYNIEQSLIRDASLITEKIWDYTKVDGENKQVEITCKITPKEIKPNQTTANLVLNEQVYPLELQNGSFTTTISLPLFESVEASRIVFTEGDIQKAEVLDWYLIPYQDILPSLQAYPLGSLTVSNGRYTMSGQIEIEIMSPFEEAEAFQELYLVETANGVEIAKTPLDKDQIDTTNQRMSIFPTVNITNETKPNTQYEVYVEAVDSYGFHYRSTVNTWETDENNNYPQNVNHSIEEEHTIYPNSNIYDAQGNLLTPIE